jgi:LacI family transcriptional regulator
MLASENRPTAIFCASDLSAIGAMKAIAEAGLSVPDDISVVGFGDFPLAKFLHPGLTSIQLPLAELGATAAKQMLALAEGKPADDVLLPCELVVRDTTGPVSKALTSLGVGG